MVKTWCKRKKIRLNQHTLWGSKYNGVLQERKNSPNVWRRCSVIERVGRGGKRHSTRKELARKKGLFQRAVVFITNPNPERSPLKILYKSPEHW